MIKKNLFILFVLFGCFQGLVGSRDLRSVKSIDPIFTMLKPGDFDKLQKYLLHNPDSVNAKNELGATPLCMASEVSNNCQTLLFLIGNGADVHAKDAFENRPLHYAILPNNYENLPNNYENIKFLLNNEANPLSRNFEGQSSLHFAAILADRAIMSWLLDSVHSYYPGKNYIDIEDNDGATALMYAMQIPNNSGVVQMLLDGKADIFKKNKMGHDVLDYALGADNNAKTINKLLDFDIFSICDVEKKLKQSSNYGLLLSGWISEKRSEQKKEIDSWQKRINELPVRRNEDSLFKTNTKHLIPICNSRGLITVDPHNLRNMVVKNS